MCIRDRKERIAHELRNLDFMNDPEATDKQEELTAMSISCDAAIIFAERHACLLYTSTNQIFFSFISVRASTTLTT